MGSEYIQGSMVKSGQVQSTRLEGKIDGKVEIQYPTTTIYQDHTRVV